LTLTGGVSVGVVETSEPGGADVSGEGPFTNPDVVLDFLGVAHGATVLIAVSTDVAVRATPSEVLMSVHNNIPHVVVVEHVVPVVGVEVEGVMEDELQAGLLFFHHLSDLTVEVLEHVKIGAIPWLVDGFNGSQSGVGTPGIEETLDGVLSPVEVVLVDGDVVAGVVIPLAHPLTESMLPVTEVVLIGPNSSIGQARIIVSVL